jgi:hypothetical protein
MRALEDILLFCPAKTGSSDSQCDSLPEDLWDEMNKFGIPTNPTNPVTGVWGGVGSVLIMGGESMDSSVFDFL